MYKITAIIFLYLNHYKTKAPKSTTLRKIIAAYYGAIVMFLLKSHIDLLNLSN